jgi:hypothetical protein
VRPHAALKLLPPLILVAFATSVAAGAAAERIYVANCGNTSYLEFRPTYWSSGCTGGSLNVRPVRWRWWGVRSARGSGTAELRFLCPKRRAWCTYRARARLRLSRPKQCRAKDGRRHWYFSVGRESVLFRAGNPLRLRAGWHTQRTTVQADQGLCTVG